MTTAGPDRGYSWVIMLSCAYIHFALFGVFRSWGVIYVAVLKDYGVTREEASWPFSLCSAVFQLISPAVSIITHYISRRLTCLLGSSVATVGVVACFFAPSALWITIFYGVVHGLGFGVVVTLIPVFLNQYFIKHRATALGIAFSGGAVGSFAVPIVMESLLENYNLRGSFLILGGLVMNTLVASALLRPAPWLKKPKNRTNLLNSSQPKDSCVSAPSDALDANKTVAPASMSPIESGFHDSAVSENSVHVQENERSSMLENSLFYSSSMDITSEIQDTQLSDTLQSDIFFDGPQVGKAFIVESCTGNKDTPKKECEVKEPLIMNGKCSSESPKVKVNKLKNAMVAIMEILKTPRFHLIALSMFIYFFSLQCFLVVIIDYALDKDIKEDSAKYIMAIFSLTDLLGRSGLGWVTDRGFVKRNNMIIFNFIAIGISMQLYPLVNDLTGMLVLAAVMGLPVGSSISLFFVLQAEYLGMKRLTLVIGLTGFINGTLTLIRPAVIGLFRDTIGSYDWMFHACGMSFYAFAIIWLAESQTSKNRNKKCAIQNAFEKA